MHRLIESILGLRRTSRSARRPRARLEEKHVGLRPVEALEERVLLYHECSPQIPNDVLPGVDARFEGLCGPRGHDDPATAIRSAAFQAAEIRGGCVNPGLRPGL